MSKHKKSILVINVDFLTVRTTAQQWNGPPWWVVSSSSVLSMHGGHERSETRDP